MEKRLRSSLQLSAEEFLSSTTKHTFKSIKPSLKTLVSRISFSSDISSSLPVALHYAINQSIESFKQGEDVSIASPSSSPPSKRVRRSSRKRNNAPESNTDTESKRNSHLQNLQIYTHILFLCISHPKEPFSPADLLPSIQSLHESMTSFESCSDLLLEIANLCEEWWKEQLPGRETLISQSLPYLVSRSLIMRKKVDVKRVYALREAFSLFDYDDEMTEDLKLLLVRCIIAPVYLKMEEGRKFIAFLFGLNSQLVKEALAMIRSQIPFGRKSMLEAYADILFRAWKSVDELTRNEIENGFLQSLVDGAVHASSVSLAASVRRILGGFISQRTTSGVEKLLFRLTEPIIFRSLQVANSSVRQNALHLLLDVFPLEDPDSTKEVKDELLERQFFLLERLLQDECPDVRVVAVEGCCRNLHLFWEIIPSPTITKTVTKIFDDISHDICNEVRLSTLNGIIYLLGNPQTHGILKVLLPRLKHLFTDPVISVRVAVVNLLIVVRDIHTFEFHKVVGLDALLSSLANDELLVAQKLTSLLIPSFFPSKATPEEACRRCMTLIKKSPLAGGRFCEFVLAEGSSRTSLMELLRILSGSLGVPSNNLTSNQIDGFLVAALNLCNSLVSEASFRDDLKKLFPGEKLKQLITAVNTERAQSTILKIASVVSPDDVTALIKECMGLINNFDGLSDNLEKQTQVRAAHKLMISSNRFGEMFETLTKLLQVAASACHVKFGLELPEQSMLTVKQKKAKPSTRSSTKSKNVKGKKLTSFQATTDTFQQQYIIACGAAWQIKDLLTSDDSRDAIVKSPMSKAAFAALKAICEVSVEHCMCLEYLDMSPVLTYIALALHTMFRNGDLAGAKDLSGSKMQGLGSTRPSVEGHVLDRSLNHLFSCTERLFAVIKSEDSINLPFNSGPDEENRSQGQKRSEGQSYGCCPATDGSSFPIQNRIFNMVKILTAVLKFTVDARSSHLSIYLNCRSSFPIQNRIFNMVKMLMTVLKFTVDASTICPVSHSHRRCLQFASEFIRVINLTLEKHSENLSELKEEDLKEMVICFKSSFTYAAKLLNLVLKNASESSLPILEASDLSNNLLNLVTSIESCFGSRRASSLVSTVKPWLPDIVLALGSCHVLTEDATERDNLTGHQGKPCIPWLTVLAKAELCELSVPNQDDESDNISDSNEFHVFYKVMEMIIQVLRRNLKVLDSVGIIVMHGLLDFLEREDYESVLGLVHFVCVKMVKPENEEWSELRLMLASLQELYPRIEKGIEDSKISEEGMHMLDNAKKLLEPVWMAYIYEDGGGSVREEE